MPDEQRISTAGLRRSIRARAAFFVFLVVGMFLPAGDTGWPKGRLFILAVFALTVPSVVYLRRQISLPVGGRKQLAGYGRSRGPRRETPLARRAVEGEHSPALRLGWDGDAAFRLRMAKLPAAVALSDQPCTASFPL